MATTESAPAVTATPASEPVPSKAAGPRAADDGAAGLNDSAWVYRAACATFVISYLPVVLGAQTTTEGAGMAFPTWPDSDGIGMFFYKFWLASRDQFLEHSHRLGGVLIGLAAIGLVAVTHLLTTRRAVRILAIGCLLAVIIQGLIGGTRVTENNPALAAVHGFTAALTVALIGVTACAASPRWPANGGVAGPLRKTKWLLAAAAVLLSVQYIFGGLMRHNVATGLSAQTSHLHNSFITFAVIIAAGVALIRTRVTWLRRSGITLHAIVTLQMFLGFVTWAKKYGAPSFGLVGDPTAPLTGYIRSGHMVLGLTLMAAMAVAMVRVWHASSATGNRTEATLSRSSGE